MAAAVVAAALPAAGGGDTFAEAEVKKPCFAPAPPDSLRPRALSPTTWAADDDLIVVEIESHPPTTHWVAETSLEGFTGDSYYRWTGMDLFGYHGAGLLSYPVEIAEPGVWELRLHSRHDHPDHSEENDIWLRVDGGEWDKMFANGGPWSVGKWTFDSQLDSTGGGLPRFTFDPGIHLIEFSARSQDFKIDRFHLFRVGTPGVLDKTLPPSDVARERPLSGETIHFEMHDPADAAWLTPGKTLSFLVANADFGAACGLVLPGIGPKGAPGEFMLGPNSIVIGDPRLWSGQATEHALPIHSAPELLGAELSAQGVFFDFSQGSPSKFVVTEGVDLLVGDH